MIKSIAIFFLSIYLISATPLDQLLKMPLLIEHFQKHQKDKEDLSFLGFINMHYFNHNSHSDHEDDDMKLPFKSININSSIIYCLAYDQPTYTFQKPIFIESSINKFSLTDRWHSNNYLEAIWQPPRVA